MFLYIRGHKTVAFFGPQIGNGRSVFSPKLKPSWASFHARYNSFNQGKKGFTPLFLTTKQCCEVGRAGFTMIEVIVATLIVAILAAGVASAFWGAKHFLNHARYRAQAYNFAVEALDRLRGNYQYSSSPAMDIGTNHAQTEIEATGILKGELTSLSGALTYDIAEPQVNGYKQVTIKVHWDEPAF